MISINNAENKSLKQTNPMIHNPKNHDLSNRKGESQVQTEPAGKPPDLVTATTNNTSPLEGPARPLKGKQASYSIR